MWRSSSASAMRWRSIPNAGVRLLKRNTITYPLPKPDAYAEAAEEPAQS